MHLQIVEETEEIMWEKYVIQAAHNMRISIF